MKYYIIVLSVMLMAANMAMSDDNSHLSSDIKVAHAAIEKLRKEGDCNALLDVIEQSRLHAARIEAISALKGCNRQATVDLVRQLEKQNVEVTEGGTEDKIMKMELKKAMVKTIASNLNISVPKDQSIQNVATFVKLPRERSAE